MGRLVWHVVQRVAKALRWPRLFGVVVNQMFVFHLFQVVCCCGGDGIWKLVFGQAKVRDIKMDGLPSRAAFERFLLTDRSKHIESRFLRLFFTFSLCLFSLFPIVIFLFSSSSISLIFSVWVLIEDSLQFRISVSRLPSGFSYCLLRLAKQTAALWASSFTAVDLSHSKLSRLHAAAVLSQQPHQLATLTRCPTFPPTLPSRLRRRSRSRNRGFLSEQPPRSGHH